MTGRGSIGGVLSRRHFLRGAGGAAIALPMWVGRERSSDAATSPPPERFIGVFVAQGLPEELTVKGLDGPTLYEHNPLSSLKPFADRTSVVRGINVLTQAPGNEHTRGSSSFLCGQDSNSVAFKGGVTLDWLIKEETGARTQIPSLNTGIYGADDVRERGRIVHSWRDVGHPNEPIPDTLDFFRYIFGDAPATVADAKRARYRVSVLDNVVEEYRAAMGTRSGFGSETRSILQSHLETVRELEIRAIAASSDLHGSCVVPEAPRSIPGNGRQPPLTENWEEAWEILTDLYVVALRCDLVRFGTIMVGSGGDRFPFRGRAGAVANVHGSVMHHWPEQHVDLALEIFDWHYTKVAGFLTKLDAPTFLDADGKTLLDSTTVLIGTELGQPGTHGLEHLTYLIAGAHGRFRPGIHNFPERTDVDLYNTILTGLGIGRRIGDPERYTGDLSFIA